MIPFKGQNLQGTPTRGANKQFMWYGEKRISRRGQKGGSLHIPQKTHADPWGT